MMRLALTLVLLLVPAVAATTQQRIASDFEIAQMQRQLENSTDFPSLLAARLNLGDARIARNEPVLARAEYERAAALAAKERSSARADGHLTRYATATSYAALAAAKLGERNRAFALGEEALRYESTSAKSWNLNATALGLIGAPRKAIASARHAVMIAEADLARDSSIANRIDLAVYRHALASALVAAGDDDDARMLLLATASSLDAPEFAALRRDVSRRESFEIYSSARGDAASYLSLVNRVNLRLATLLERAGDSAGARRHFERVLQQRSDEPAALAGLARLAAGSEEREQRYAAAFDANPFSPALVKRYREHLRGGAMAAVDESTTGGAMRAALAALERGDHRKARTILSSLATRFPSNATLDDLLAETDAPPASLGFLATGGELAAQQLNAVLDALAANRLTADERTQLDRATFTSVASFDEAIGDDAGTTSFARGSIGAVRFRFAQDTAFRGEFPAGAPLRLTYRILGATRDGDTDALLVEPLRLEVIR